MKLNTLEFLPLYRWAFPLHSNGNLLHVSLEQREQILMCDMIKKEAKPIYACPPEAMILEDIGSLRIFSVYVNGEFCIVEDISSDEQMRIPLIDSSESVISASGNYGYIFIKIALEQAEEQTFRLMLVDFKQKKYVQITNETITNSYKLPYIVKQNKTIFAIIEDSDVFPYEISELAKVNSQLCKNRIVSTDIENLLSSIGNDGIPFYEIMNCQNAFQNYIQIMQVNRNTMLVSIGDNDNMVTGIACIDFTGQKIADTVNVNDKVWGVVEDANYNIYYVSWKKDIVVLYNSSGSLIAKIELDKLYSDVPYIECNKLINVFDSSAVFDATDYSGNAALQIRVTFDFLTGHFSVIKNSFISIQDHIC